MRYTPHTEQEVAAMLQTLGMKSVDDLFGAVPEGLRLNRRLSLGEPLSEAEAARIAADAAGQNGRGSDLVCFAGGGAYDHYVPAVVGALGTRAEFLTAYTPYQPELSQGTLQALYEYQTMICELTGMEVANSSLYDGAGALAEAVHLAVSSTGRPKIAVSEAINPNYRQVLETLGAGPGYQFVTAGASGGTTEQTDLGDAACLIIGQPNFYGCIEDVRAAADAAHSAGALLVVHYDPLSAGVLEAPGALGADIVTGEGQSLGASLNYGGPYLGIFAARREHLRAMPGRIVGETLDGQGRRGFVLTLQAREQHIRRERATSNICTDQTLLAIGAAIYLSWLGPAGLRELGERCWAAAHFAAEQLAAIPGCALAFDRPFFKEFVLEVPRGSATVAERLFSLGILAGPVVDGPGDRLLVAVTESRTKNEILRLVEAVRGAVT